MKKAATCLVLLSVLAFCYYRTAEAASQGDACDPRKVSECCNKIQKTITELDALKAKLEKLRASIEKDKKLTHEQADRTFRYIENIDAFLKHDEIQDFGLED